MVIQRMKIYFNICSLVPKVETTNLLVLHTSSLLMTFSYIPTITPSNTPSHSTLLIIKRPRTYLLPHLLTHSLLTLSPLPGTRTPLHRDQGGLSILINVIVGQKEVTMVHSSDGHKIGYGEFDPNCPSFATHPQAAFSKAWRVVLNPGDLLVMPAGTCTFIMTISNSHSLTCLEVRERGNLLIRTLIIPLQFFSEYYLVQCSFITHFHYNNTPSLAPYLTVYLTSKARTTGWSISRIV